MGPLYQLIADDLRHGSHHIDGMVGIDEGVVLYASHKTQPRGQGHESSSAR
jgi:hypothetical protein